MMFDWDKIVIEVDNNVVDLTAGEVALLIAADADTVTWGNITGDMTQQPDLMLELDSKVGVDSPVFTGAPRTPTPPAGNISTRIANTEFVDGAVNAIIPEGGFGTLANKNSVDYQTDVTNKPALGALASKNSVNYDTEVTNKPTLGTLATKNWVNYATEVSNKPVLGKLASKDTVNYYTEVMNTPNLGSLASKNTVDFERDVTNKPAKTPSAFGDLAALNTVNYNTQVTNKPNIPVMPSNTPASFGTLASKNSVDYETEVYNKPSSSGEVGQDDIARIHLTPQNSLLVNEGDFRWYRNNLYMANWYYYGRWADAPSGTFTIKYLADEVTAKFNKEATARVLNTDNGPVEIGEYFIFGNKLYRVDFLPTQGESPTEASSNVKLADEVRKSLEINAPYFNMYNMYGIGDYVWHNNELKRFILEHRALEWDEMDVVSTNLSNELSTAEKTIKLSESDKALEDLIRGAGAHANTKIVVDVSGSHNVKTLVISGHKRIAVWSSNDDSAIARFNGDYGTEKHLLNLFYSIIVENGAILELKGYTKVWHANSNGILIRNGGMVIHHGTLDIDLPSTNYHDGIYIESGGKFISDGTITATRGSTVYQDYPSHVIYVDYGGEAHVKNISANYYNYCIGCRGGVASYNSISGAGVTTSAGGRIFTGAQ